MEAVIEVYEKAYNPGVPVLCMDEQPVQLVKDVRPPISATARHPKRVDFEYERAGVASLFLFCEPLAGWREVSVRTHHTKVDWAQEMAKLLTGRYAKCEKVFLVCDHLATHTAGAFYEAFDAATARSLVKRIEFVKTPKHGSWLNVSECELSAMTRQCVKGRRFGTIEELQKETRAWFQAINTKQRLVDWQFTLENARVELKSLYPKLIS
jgi:DDE superfamily endonuclease